MYKFNPISDISLFENIENQHFYKRENVENKKTGLYQYIYLFHDAKIIKNKKDNEIFKKIHISIFLIIQNIGRILWI